MQGQIQTALKRTKSGQKQEVYLLCLLFAVCIDDCELGADSDLKEESADSGTCMCFTICPQVSHTAVFSVVTFEERCVTTLKSAARVTMGPLDSLQFLNAIVHVIVSKNNL